MAYKQRLNKLEHGKHGEYLDIIQLVRQGAYYDELSEVQKKQYIAYRESLGGVADDVSCAELEVEFMDAPEQTAFHFQLSKRQKPPTREELDKKIAEVQQILFS